MSALAAFRPVDLLPLMAAAIGLELQQRRLEAGQDGYLCVRTRKVVVNTELPGRGQQRTAVRNVVLARLLATFVLSRLACAEEPSRALAYADELLVPELRLTAHPRTQALAAFAELPWAYVRPDVRALGRDFRVPQSVILRRLVHIGVLRRGPAGYALAGPDEVDRGQALKVPTSEKVQATFDGPA